MDDIRSGYAERQDLWLLARLSSTKAEYEGAVFESIRKETRQIASAEVQRDAVLDEAKAVGAFNPHKKSSDFEEHSDDGKADSERSLLRHGRPVDRARVDKPIRRWLQEARGTK